MRYLILFYPIGVVWANSPYTTKLNKRRSAAAHWEREQRVSNVCSPVCCGWLVLESSSWEHVSSRWVVLGVGDPKATHTYKHRITLTRSHVQPSLRSILLSTCFGFYVVAAARKNLLEANWMLDEANWMPCFLWRRASSVWLRPLQRQVQRTEFFVRHRRRDRRLIRLRRFQLLLLCTPNVVFVVVVVRVVVSFVVHTGTKKAIFVGRYRLKGGKLKANKVLFCLNIRRKIQVNPSNYSLFEYCFKYKVQLSRKKPHTYPYWVSVL